MVWYRLAYPDQGLFPLLLAKALAQQQTDLERDKLMRRQLSTHDMVPSSLPGSSGFRIVGGGGVIMNLKETNL